MNRTGGTEVADIEKFPIFILFILLSCRKFFYK